MGKSKDKWSVPDGDNRRRMRMGRAAARIRSALEPLEQRLLLSSAIDTMSISAAIGQYGGSVVLTVSLADSQSRLPLANEPVTFSLNGRSLATINTDVGGLATLAGISLAGLSAGSYPNAAEAQFSGDGTYAPLTAMNSLTVLPSGASNLPWYAVTQAFPAGSYAPQAINDNGQLAGFFTSNNGQQHAFTTTNGVVQDLGTLGGDESAAYGLNNNGQVVGWSLTGVLDRDHNDIVHAFVYSNGTMKDLGVIPGYDFPNTKAQDINDNGQIAGWFNGWIDFVGGKVEPFLSTGGDMQPLAIPPGYTGGFDELLDINNSGAIVGPALSLVDGTRSDGGGVAFIYQNGTMTSIGDLGGLYQATGRPYSASYAINDIGQVVGTSTSTTTGPPYGFPVNHAFLYHNGILTDLTPGSTTDTDAEDINNNGQIVGWEDYSSSPYGPYIYEDGELHDLNSLILPGTGGVASVGYDYPQYLHINQSGQILAPGYLPSSIGGAGLVLSPISNLLVQSAASEADGTVELDASLSALGAPLAGKTITFYANGKPVGAALTDSSGVAILKDVNVSGIDAGTYTGGIVAAFSGDTNYTASKADADLVVTGTMTPIVTVTAPSTVYSASPYAGATYQVLTPKLNAIPGATATLEFFSSSDPLTQLSEPPRNAGTYLVVAHFPGGSGYKATDSSPVAFTIIKAPLSLVANNETLQFGQPIPAPPALSLGTVTGLFAGDTIIAGFDTTATTFSPPGKYVIGVFFDYTGDLLNYDVSASSGTLTITPLSLHADSVTALANTLQGLINGVQASGRNATIPLQLSGGSNGNADFQMFLQALALLSINPSKPGVTLSVDLNGQTVTDSQISVPAGLSLALSNGTFVGGSPALVVTAGSVAVSHCALVNATDAPALLVTGGNLVLRDDSVQQQSIYSDPAIKVTGGTIDLGTASDPGNNTLSAGAGAMLIGNTSGNPLAVPVDMSAGNVFEENGTPITPDSVVQGEVWVDFNNDGSVDFNEVGLNGASITLTGTDTLGRPVNLTTTTAGGGIYELTSLWPGQYSIAEGATPPYVEGKDSLGVITDASGNVVSTAQRGDASVQDVFSNVILGSGQSATNYNFGEQPAPGSPVSRGQAAGIGFWASPVGVNLIVNGFGKEAGLWLSATLPNLFGSGSTNDLSQSTSGWSVAWLFVKDFISKDKLDAQMLATALNVYATTASLGGSVAARYGFAVTQYGLADSTWNVGRNGAAFGVANNTSHTVLQLLQDWDAQTNRQNVILRKAALHVFGEVNETADAPEENRPACFR